MPREIITLQCTECKRRNYTTEKNKKTQSERLELKKYCRFDRRHVAHRRAGLHADHQLVGGQRERGFAALGSVERLEMVLQRGQPAG